jgi:uncharacterized protein DUF6328
LSQRGLTLATIRRFDVAIYIESLQQENSAPGDAGARGRRVAQAAQLNSGYDVARSARPCANCHPYLQLRARVVLPGAQALFGFQLAIVLTQSFEQLPTASMIMHATSLFLVAFAVVLLMAPAAYHRIVYAGEDSEDMHRVGSVLVTAATVPLALGLAGDVYVVVTKIIGSPTAGLIAGSLALVLLIGLWHVYPLVAVSIQDRGAK